jgi:hypothetical protein
VGTHHCHFAITDSGLQKLLSTPGNQIGTYIPMIELPSYVLYTEQQHLLATSHQPNNFHSPKSSILKTEGNRYRLVGEIVCKSGTCLFAFQMIQLKCCFYRGT